jgi:predicted dehydrogenase
MKKINWGIIGCGDVTEVKSGPAFNKVNHSSLVAVMRRDADKAEDYARRHHVPKWYADAHSLIHDPDVNAIYVATPPSSHEEYTIAALQAGKPVYVEKPMSVSAAAAARMREMAQETNVKLVVAHYRREQPRFKKIRQLLAGKVIGEIRLARMHLYRKPLTATDLAVPKTAWRVDAAVAGGGLFHDLSPHQLDLLYYFFGEADKVCGLAANQQKQYAAEDIVSGTILFRSGTLFNGVWCFNAAAVPEKDSCEIIGSEGTICFSVFGQDSVTITREQQTETLLFDPLEHVQQPMIRAVVDYFLDEGPNPCPASDGVTVMQWIDLITGK